MNSKPRTGKAFTLIELVAAIAILAVIASFAGAVFKISIEAYRVAGANAEIMQKLRAITDQLNADFKGLRKDGEIFMVWTAWPANPSFDADDVDGYVRSDRIMFFADGDFQTYHQRQGDIRGNVARISYMLASRRGENPGDDPDPVPLQKRQERMLARTQHILTADEKNAHPFVDPCTLSTDQLDEWHNLYYEYDKISLAEWKNMPWPSKKVALSTITGIIVDNSSVQRGALVHPGDPRSTHILLCQGVGEFKIQGWYETEAGRWWVPEINRDHDGAASPEDTDFFYFLDSGEFDVVNAPGVLYPYPPSGLTKLRGIIYDPNFLTEEHFNEIPGLGRALKFTFTLYDSKGIIKRGRTFTHIVHLDN
jgi:prepilin-type N-terminal cleavage/methylation domain-containing protein